MIEADGQQNIGRQLQVPSPDEESLAAHGREQEHPRPFMGPNHVEQRGLIEVRMHLSGVHHVDAEQRQVKIEMAPDGTQRAAAAPDDHEVLVLHQQADVLGHAFDGVLFGLTLDLFLGALHEAWACRRPSFTVHPDAPFPLQVNLFVEVHHFGQGRPQIALREGHQHLGCGRRRGRKATAVHLDATGHADERCCGRFLTEPAEGLDDVAGRAVAARIEHRINTR